MKSGVWTFHEPCFAYEARFDDAEWPWTGHRRFVYDLVRNTGPETIVELGTHRGTSFFAFCQAIQDGRLGTRIHAVDTWRGDAQAGFYGDEVFALKKLKKSFGDRVLFHDVDLQVRGGERIALIGDNGTGKSTLIKMLMEEEYPDEGKIKFGPSVRIAYLPQIVEFDVPERNLVDTMLYSKRNITPQSARNRLAAFHFTGEDVFKSVSVLSGGELSRLKLCILMDEEVNLLILDEPTNHLDIASREWIEEAVESYDGTLLFVSHDRYFINRFATRVWELENGVITDYPMGFARYRQVKALEAQNKIDHTPKTVKEKTVTEKPKPNRSAQQARRQLTICEKEISAQETAIAEIEQRLEEAGGDYERYSEIYKEKEAAEQKLSELMEKWETLAEQAGE